MSHTHTHVQGRFVSLMSQDTSKISIKIVTLGVDASGPSPALTAWPFAIPVALIRAAVRRQNAGIKKISVSVLIASTSG